MIEQTEEQKWIHKQIRENDKHLHRYSVYNTYDESVRSAKTLPLQSLY